MQWMPGGNVIIVLRFVINAVFRGAGDAAAAMRVPWAANALNIVLDPLLIFGLGPVPVLGGEGAAITTTLGRGAGVLMPLWILLRGSEHLRIGRAALRWHGNTMLQMVRTSLGGIGQMIVAMTAWIFLRRILASVSTEAVTTPGLSLCQAKSDVPSVAAGVCTARPAARRGKPTAQRLETAQASRACRQATMASTESAAGLARSCCARTPARRARCADGRPLAGGLDAVARAAARRRAERR